ncbi:MAG: exonuclease SbcCD subunit D [Oscillospiraceae bacterium]|nr:exonuclease SbcCD subunit D [Oscillospiraceae bacterium]
MKLIHLSDLHLGKRIYECSMLEDQAYILSQILELVDAEQPDGVLIAGDIYDKPVPPAEAVQLFDRFLVELAERGLEVYVISGNHDSPERIAFGARLMDRSGIHVAPVYCGEVLPFSWQDAYGTVKLYLLPFLKPIQARRHFGDGIDSYTEALRAAISHMAPDPTARNVLVTHQFVTGAQRTESEELAVGGSENVDAGVFAPFDYVALGHLHRPQICGAAHIRYCGSPLKYSFSEAKDQKSLTVVELLEKGRVLCRTVPLVPKRELVELRGRYAELTLRSFYENTGWQEDYIHITLTDEEDIPDALGKLRSIYHRLMKLDYDNTRTRTNQEIGGALELEAKSPFTLFAEFYELQNNQPLSEAQTDYLNERIAATWEDEA